MEEEKKLVFHEKNEMNFFIFLFTRQAVFGADEYVSALVGEQSNCFLTIAEFIGFFVAEDQTGEN